MSSPRQWSWFPSANDLIQNIIKEAACSYFGLAKDTREETISKKEQDCVIDIWKDGITVGNGVQLLSTSTPEHRLLGGLVIGIARTIYRQASISLAEDADIVIRFQPEASCKATQNGLIAGQMLSRVETQRRARDEMEALLVRNNVTPEQARLATLNELNGWSFQQVEAIFRQLPPDPKSFPLGPPFNLPGARGLKQYVLIGLVYCGAAIMVILSSPILLSLFLTKGPSRTIEDLNLPQMAAGFHYIKPPLKVIRAAAESGAALCVNRRGQFRLLNNGYTALSHVDAQTFGWNGPKGTERVPEDARGLNYFHLLKILDGIKVPKDEWVWLDNLAIPQYLDVELKSRCINQMPKIYQNAGRVLILDALTLQMKTPSLIDVAVVLACGQWITRAWCYQELKLADWSKAAVVTANGKANVASMLDQLHEMAGNDEMIYQKLFKTFVRLWKPNNQLTFGDISAACQSRRAGLDEDYARAFYPTLGLSWKPEYTRIEGMVKLYESRPQQAAQLAALHGPRGLPDPWGWAPAYLCGNEGMIRNDLAINNFGNLIGTWWSVEITQVVKSIPHGPVRTVHTLTASSRTNPGREPIQVSVNNGSHLRKTLKEKLEMVEATDKRFKEWADKIQSKQKTFLLCSEDMDKDRDFPAQVLLIATEETSQSLEAGHLASESGPRARVYLSAALTAGKCLGTQEEWTLM